MAARVPPLVAADRSAASRALARALWATAAGSATAVEREWLGRVERRRAELAADAATAPPGFGSSAAEMPDWAAAVDRPLPISETSLSMSIPPLECRFLFRLIRELRPDRCLELGTGFGVSTAYQAAALALNGTGRLLTLDAAAQWAQIAREGFAALGLEHVVEMRVGPIDAELTGGLDELGAIDYALLDADHTERATLEHFEALLPRLPATAVVALDDINWTDEMRRAWAAVRRHPRTGAAVGLGRIGVAVVRGR